MNRKENNSMLEMRIRDDGWCCFVFAANTCGFTVHTCISCIVGQTARRSNISYVVFFPSICPRPPSRTTPLSLKHLITIVIRKRFGNQYAFCYDLENNPIVFVVSSTRTQHHHQGRERRTRPSSSAFAGAAGLLSCRLLMAVTSPLELVIENLKG